MYPLEIEVRVWSTGKARAAAFQNKDMQHLCKHLAGGESLLWNGVTYCQWKGPVIPSFSRSLRDLCREGPGPGGRVPAPAGIGGAGARAGDDIVT